MLRSDVSFERAGSQLWKQQLSFRNSITFLHLNIGRRYKSQSISSAFTLLHRDNADNQSPPTSTSSVLGNVALGCTAFI